MIFKTHFSLSWNHHASQHILYSPQLLSCNNFSNLYLIDPKPCLVPWVTFISYVLSSVRMQQVPWICWSIFSLIWSFVMVSSWVAHQPTWNVSVNYLLWIFLWHASIFPPFCTLPMCLYGSYQNEQSFFCQFLLLFKSSDHNNWTTDFWALVHSMTSVATLKEYHQPVKR